LLQQFKLNSEKIISRLCVWVDDEQRRRWRPFFVYRYFTILKKATLLAFFGTRRSFVRSFFGFYTHFFFLRAI
jgi:hypothetical protein